MQGARFKWKACFLAVRLRKLALSIAKAHGITLARFVAAEIRTDYTCSPPVARENIKCGHPRSRAARSVSVLRMGVLKNVRVTLDSACPAGCVD